MEHKPVTPALHGVIDYVFAGVQLTAPAALSLNRNVVTTYRTLGAGFLAINALTDTPVAVKPVLSFETHRRLDASFLVGLTLLSFAPFIRNDRAARGFHLGFLGTAIAHYVLTDYAAGSQP